MQDWVISSVLFHFRRKENLSCGKGIWSGWRLCPWGSSILVDMLFQLMYTEPKINGNSQCETSKQSNSYTYNQQC